MNTACKWLQNYLLIAAPFVVGVMFWSSFEPGGQPASTALGVRALWEVLSWNLMLWFVALLFFFVTLVLNARVREQTLKRIANIRDSDEREEWITGKASKSSYIATLSLLILLLFFSLFTLRVDRHDTDPKRKLSIGLNFRLFESGEPAVVPPGTQVVVASGTEVTFESRDIPITKTGILLLVLFWQMGTYYVSVRRELAE